MDKPFRTYDELIIMLRDEKNLTIPDENRVKYLLKKHSYFSLVSGYKSLFKDQNGKYKEGTTIEDLFALFEFDDRLREIFFRRIQSIEKHIKSLLAYEFVSKYGEGQKEYLDPAHYLIKGNTDKETDARCKEIRKLIETLEDTIRLPTQRKYIEHQKTKHNNVPLWAAIKAITFGTTSKMYSFCYQDVQAAISKEFQGVNETQLERMLDYLTLVRNVCAHNERLYDYQSGKRAIKAMPIHQDLNIGKKKTYYKKGQRDLFAAVICFKYLLEENEYNEFIDEVDAAINQLMADTKMIQRTKILSCMGFPTNWKDSVRM
ncbi:MAG: Abi family protein [Oscillospiraceae bacterium]|nr:Abi family protein [Oscillospiraceae bacterium]